MYSIRAKREIQKFRSSINVFLDTIENELDQQVLQMKVYQTSKWMSTSKQIEKLDNIIKKINSTKEQTNKSGQRCNSYINMKRNVQQLKQLEDCMEKIKKESKVSEYIFKPDENLQKVMKETKTLGMFVTFTEGRGGYGGRGGGQQGNGNRKFLGCNYEHNFDRDDNRQRHDRSAYRGNGNTGNQGWSDDKYNYDKETRQRLHRSANKGNGNTEYENWEDECDKDRDENRQRQDRSVNKVELNIFTQHFMKKKGINSSIDFFKNNIDKLSEIEKSKCEGQLTEYECAIVLKQMQNAKSPGSDVITTEFYKIY